MKQFNGVKVISATMVADRDRLGDKVEAFLKMKRDTVPGFELVELPTITQSSDEAFHCIAITLFYYEPVGARR